jgi:hypothetical protein
VRLLLQQAVAHLDDRPQGNLVHNIGHFAFLSAPKFAGLGLTRFCGHD